MRSAARSPSSVEVGGGAGDVEAGSLEDECQALAHQGLVLADHYPHGTSATSRVPRPGGLSTRRFPPSASMRSSIPRSPAPVLGVAPPMPSSPISMRSERLSRA